MPHLGASWKCWEGSLLIAPQGRACGINTRRSRRLPLESRNTLAEGWLYPISQTSSWPSWLGQARRQYGRVRSRSS